MYLVVCTLPGAERPLANQGAACQVPWDRQNQGMGTDMGLRPMPRNEAIRTDQRTTISKGEPMRGFMILALAIAGGCGSLERTEYERCDFAVGPVCPENYLCVNYDADAGPRCYGACGWDAPEQDRCQDNEVCTRLTVGGLDTNYVACLPEEGL